MNNRLQIPMARQAGKKFALFDGRLAVGQLQWMPKGVLTCHVIVALDSTCKIKNNGDCSESICSILSGKQTSPGRHSTLNNHTGT